MSFSPRNELVDTLITGQVIGYQHKIHGPSIMLLYHQWHKNTPFHQNFFLKKDGSFSFNVRINVVQNCGVGLGAIAQFALRPGIPIYLELAFTEEKEEGFELNAPNDDFTQMSIELMSTLTTTSDWDERRERLSKAKSPEEMHTIYDKISERALRRLPAFQAKNAPFPKELYLLGEQLANYSFRREILFNCLQFLGEDKSLKALTEGCKYVFRQELPELSTYHMMNVDIIQKDSNIIGSEKFFGQAMPTEINQRVAHFEEKFQRFRDHYTGFAHDIAYCNSLFWMLGRLGGTLPGLIDRVENFLQLTPYPALREPLAHLLAVVKGDISPVNAYEQRMNQLPEGIDNPLPAILEQHRGKVIVLDFWSTFCGPCVHELKEVYPRVIPHYSPDEVAFVFFCRQSSEAAWRECINTLQFSAEHYLTNREQTVVLNELFGITGIPHHVIFDQAGTLVQGKVAGPGRGLEAAIDALLNGE
jgi:thiol-disulfide isomerase/thioredoxin